MKIFAEENEVLSNAAGKTIDYRINTGSHLIFDILRSKMYSDPIGSICREIMDNARDAHREVGTPDRPIEVIMPGDYMVVRDFGPGISPDRIENIYAEYGSSTKRADNSQGGGFGLGAKTPFAYSDQFNVVTVVDGIEYVYNMYIDETRKGKIQLLSEQPTNKENGTEVRVPVKYYDRETFRNAILHYSSYWHLANDATPKLIGQLIQRELVQPVMQGTNWIGFATNVPGVIVNGIPYEVGSHRAWPDNVTLIFQTGELDLSSNRETLHYTERTKKALDRAFSFFNEEVVAQSKAAIAKCDNIFSVIDIINTYNSTLKSDNDIIWEWNGKTFRYPTTGLGWVYRVKTNYWGNNRKGYEVQEVNKLPSGLSKSRVVIVTDEQFTDGSLKKSVRAKLTRYIDETIKDKRVFLVKAGHAFITDGVEYSNINFARTSHGGGGGTGRPKGQVKGFIPNSNVGYFLDIDRNGQEDIVYFNREMVPVRFTNYLEELALNYNTQIVGLAPANAKRVAGVDGWIHLNDWYDNLLNEIDINLVVDKLTHELAVTENKDWEFLVEGNVLDRSELGLYDETMFDVFRGKENEVKLVVLVEGLDARPVTKLTEKYPVLNIFDKSRISGYWAGKDKKRNKAFACEMFKAWREKFSV